MSFVGMQQKSLVSAADGWPGAGFAVAGRIAAPYAGNAGVHELLIASLARVGAGTVTAAGNATDAG